MKFQVEQFTSIDETQWRQLSSGASFYQGYDWIRACREALGSEAVACTLRQSGHLIGAIPGIISSRLGMKTFASMPFGTYGGIIWRNTPEEEQKRAICSGIEDALSGLSISKAHIADYSGSFDSLQLSGFKMRRHYTQLLSLGQAPYSPDKKIMTEIHKGQEAGGEIRRLSYTSDIDIYYDLYRYTEERHGRKKLPYSREFLFALLKSLVPSAKLYWIGLFNDDRMIGAQIHFIEGDKQYYWQAVSGGDARDFRSDYRLLLNAIHFGQQQGVTEVNMGASPDDAHGLVFFKKRWGSVKREYMTYEYSSGLRRIIGR